MFPRFIKTKDPTHFTEFKKFPNNLNTDLKKAKPTYYDNKFSAVMNSPKLLWQAANCIIKGRKICISTDYYIDAKSFSGLPLANKLNEQNVFLMQARQIPHE